MLLIILKTTFTSLLYVRYSLLSDIEFNSRLRACSCHFLLIGSLGYLIQEVLMAGYLLVPSAHNLWGRFRMRISQNSSCAIFSGS